VLLLLAVCLMAVAAARRIPAGFAQLLVDETLYAGVDFEILHDQMQDWYDGAPVYPDPIVSTHPPANFIVWWPALGWLERPAARLIWAALSGAALAWLAVICVLWGRARAPLGHVALALVPLASYAICVVIGIGQISLIATPPLFTALYLLYYRRPGWLRDLLIAALYILALSKPSLSAPFCFLLLFGPGGKRVALLVAALYAALTFAAAPFQEGSALELLAAWALRAQEGATFGAKTGGYLSLANGLAFLGYSGWRTIASLIALGGIGTWCFVSQRRDPALQVAVVAIFARLWTYHRVYDDMLLILTLVGLVRLARWRADGGADDPAALILAGLLLGTQLFPPMVMSAASPQRAPFVVALGLVWAVAFTFLISRSLHSGTQQAPSQDGAASAPG